MFRTTLRGPPDYLFTTAKLRVQQTIERAALVATDKAAERAMRQVRSGMARARLGRLGNAIGFGSDLKKTGRVHRTGPTSFSASGFIYIRSRSERARGAIEAYTEGAEIRPVRGKWLWIATNDIPQRVGRFRMTPERYRTSGQEQRIGPLVFIRSVNGYPLLVVKNVGVSAVGKGRSARNLKQNGQPRKGQRLREFLVAFYAIPRTSRSARVSVPAIVQQEASQMYVDLARVGQI